MVSGAAVEVVKDELRCKRSDGKRWRCSAGAMSGYSMCEKHFKQTQDHGKKRKDKKQTKKIKSIQDFPGFAQDKWEVKGGNAGFQEEQEALEIGSNEDEATEMDIAFRNKSLTRMVLRENPARCTTHLLYQSTDRQTRDFRETLTLLLQNLTRTDFIEDIITLKVQRCKEDPDATWKVFECNPYVLGEPENPDMYFRFLDYLCKLAEEDHTVVDDIFGAAEKGSTGEGDRIEFIFRSYSQNEVGTRAVFEPVEGIYIMGYSRKLPSPKEWGGRRVCVHLTLSQFLKGREQLSALEGAALPIAFLLPADHSNIT